MTQTPETHNAPFSASHTHPMSTHNSYSQFSLSHRDGDKLRDQLSAKADEALAAEDYAKFDAYVIARSMLHDARMESFQKRADKRRVKRCEALDSKACKDG